jgi:hypothetical protein
MDIERNLALVGFPADTFKKTNSLSLELIIVSNKLKKCQHAGCTILEGFFVLENER